MDKIVVIGANSFQEPIIEKAKAMGYETHVFAWKDGSIGEKTADYFYPISIIEKDAILEKCKEIAPKAVVTIASDLANVTVQYVASHLGLISNSERSVMVSTNKYLMREALLNKNIPTPRFAKITADDSTDIVADLIKDMRFPLIVKPTDRSGSRGVTKVYSENDICSALASATENSFEKKAIIEEYIDGKEYSCESISYNGKHYILAVTKKYTTGEPHFIETGHIEPADLAPSIYDKIKREIPNALDALFIKNGASHSEFKIDKNNNIKIIEIGSRMGGDCIGSHLVFLSQGYDFVKMVIDTSLGNPPDMTRKREPMCAGIRFIYTQKDLDIYERIKLNKPDLIYCTSEIGKIGSHKVVDSSTRFGYFIVISKDPNEIKEIIEE